MRKFLKIYYKLNNILSLILMMYCALAFISSLFEIEFLTHYIQLVQDFTTFGLASGLSSTIYLASIAFFAFFSNQYFSKVYLTLYNFDKFREISGLSIIPIFSIVQVIINSLLIGIFAFIPLVLNILSTILLVMYQKKNRKLFEPAITTTEPIINPEMHEMSLKIGQLRLLKSEGKISEEEFMFHLNNILENKE